MVNKLTKEDYANHERYAPRYPMTVGELIQKLQQFDENLIIINRIPSFNGSISKVNCEKVYLLENEKLIHSVPAVSGMAIVIR
mgnify:CR=1 FL=1